MRPVNLIPTNERHGSQAPMRTGPLPYIVVVGLLAALIGVTALVLTSNQIAERKEEIVTLKQEDAAAEARAQKLAAYVQLAQMRETRMATVASLADSRFDWERVMRELSKILPPDVWLTSLNASASPSAGSAGGDSSGSGGGASTSGMRGSIAGPALEISGCANGQDGVAGFVTALKEIDGVTRVGVQSSGIAAEGSGTEGGGGGEGEGAGSSSDCRTRHFIAQFQLVVAFDAAPIPPVEGAEAAVEAAPAPAPSESTSEGSATTTSTPPEG